MSDSCYKVKLHDYKDIVLNQSIVVLFITFR